MSYNLYDQCRRCHTVSLLNPLPPLLPPLSVPSLRNYRILARMRPFIT